MSNAALNAAVQREELASSNRRANNLILSNMLVPYLQKADGAANPMGDNTNAWVNSILRELGIIQ